MKTLRDKTVCEWEESLEKAKKITTDFLENVDMIDKELAQMAKEMHKQVDVILYQSKRTLQQMRILNLTKLQKQEKYISGRLQKLKEDVARYEDQLKYADPSALLQYKQGIAEDEAKPPSLETAQMPVFIKGQNDVNSMENMFGRVSIQECRAEPSESSIAIRKGSSGSKSLQKSLSLISRWKLTQSTFEVDYKYPHITCMGQGLAWVRTGKEQLQLINRDGSAIDTINIDFIVLDLALTSDGDLLLADWTNSCVKSVSIQKEITTLCSTNRKP